MNLLYEMYESDIDLMCDSYPCVCVIQAANMFIIIMSFGGISKGFVIFFSGKVD